MFSNPIYFLASKTIKSKNLHRRFLLVNPEIEKNPVLVWTELNVLVRLTSIKKKLTYSCEKSWNRFIPVKSPTWIRWTWKSIYSRPSILRNRAHFGYRLIIYQKFGNFMKNTNFDVSKSKSYGICQIQDNFLWEEY